ncbi:hypothetical protein E1832_03360, partial [Antarcticimicrobium luteum]
AESAFSHCLSPRLENRLTSNRGLFRGAGHIGSGRCLHQKSGNGASNRAAALAEWRGLCAE